MGERPEPNPGEQRRKLVDLARRWETQAEQVLRNAAACGTTAVDLEGFRACHGYLLHCAGELHDVL